MSKNVISEKALKAVMAGAVAFTPVIAVGVNAEKASAATSSQETADQLAKAYFSMGTAGSDRTKRQDIVNKVLEVLNDSTVIGYFVEENAFGDTGKRTKLISEMKELVKPLNTTSESAMATDLKTRFDKFASTMQTDLESYGDVNELLSYINSITSDLIDTSGELDVTKTPIDLEPLYKKIRTNLFDQNTLPEKMRDLLKEPTTTEALALVNKIETKVNPPVVTPPPGPGPSPTPTPDKPVVDDKKGQVTATPDAVVSNPQSVIDVIKNAEQIDTFAVTVKPGTDDIAIPFTIVSALENKNADATVAVSSELATYHLPVAEINSSDIAKQLGVATSELKLAVSMKKVTNPLTSQSTYKVLSDAVDFKASLQAPDGKSVELTVFVKPVQRTITTQSTLDPMTTLGVMVDANGNIHAVPTYVKADKKNTDLYRAGNSTYTLIQNFKTFNDVDNGKNWAEDYIEKLASKMVVNGTTATTFDPNRSISRGEFAALLSRGLGLTAQNSTVKFSDVSSGQAFNKNGEIASVVEAGIVKGDKNGKFRPYDTITRDEAAIMISRAMDFIDSEFVKLEAGKKVSHFEDYRYIGGTARPHIEKVYQAGYLGGFSNGTFGPAKETERAQMAKILYNFLQSIHYIN